MTSHAVGIPPGGLAPGIGTVMPTVPGNILNEINSAHKLDLLGLALHCMAENYGSLFWFSSVSNHWMPVFLLLVWFAGLPQGGASLQLSSQFPVTPQLGQPQASSLDDVGAGDDLATGILSQGECGSSVHHAFFVVDTFVPKTITTLYSFYWHDFT